MLSIKEAEYGDPGVSQSITPTKVTEVVEKLKCGKVPWLGEVCTVYLKSVDVVELSWVIHLFNIA